MPASRYLQKTVNKILLVVSQDDDQRKEALRYAVGLAVACGASIIAVSPPSLPMVRLPSTMGFAPLPTGQVLEVQHREHEELLEKTVKEVERQGVECKAIRMNGAGFGSRAVAEAAKRNGCDLVVIASRPKSWFLGDDLAKDVVKSAPCPVVVIK